MILSNKYFEYYTNSISIHSLKKKHHNNKCLFLDRDGVFIDEVFYIDSPEKVKLSKNIIPFLDKIRENHFDIVILTNQSSVSRGIISFKDYKEITERILSFLSEKLYPDLILASFHLPNNKSNLKMYEWRKPGVGMFKYALEKYKYDISESIMIGDKITDLIPASYCGISKLLYYPSTLHLKESKNIRNWNNKEKQKIKTLNKFNPDNFF